MYVHLIMSNLFHNKYGRFLWTGPPSHYRELRDDPIQSKRCSMKAMGREYRHRDGYGKKREYTADIMSKRLCHDISLLLLFYILNQIPTAPTSPNTSPNPTTPTPTTPYLTRCGYVMGLTCCKSMRLAKFWILGIKKNNVWSQIFEVWL